MTEKNIQILDAAQNTLYPKTITDMVFNEDGNSIANVEPNAQVNVIEKVTVNGVELEIIDKTVNVTADAVGASEYSIEKAEIAEDGYSASYQLTKDGTAVGDKINIPKDLVVESGSVKVCESADSPVTGYNVGDKYIDLVIANSDDEHIYILVSDLVDTYTAGDGIIIEGQTVSVDIDALKETFAQTSDEYTKTEIEELLAEKADKAETLEGYGIVDAYTKEETDEAISNAIQALDCLYYEELA